MSINFNATGRKLFEHEKISVYFMQNIYQKDFTIEMKIEKQKSAENRIRKQIEAGLPVSTDFYLGLQEYLKSIGHEYDKQALNDALFMGYECE